MNEVDAQLDLLYENLEIIRILGRKSKERKKNGINLVHFQTQQKGNSECRIEYVL